MSADSPVIPDHMLKSDKEDWREADGEGRVMPLSKGEDRVKPPASGGSCLEGPGEREDGQEHDK
jgi:hypothetical protein